MNKQHDKDWEKLKNEVWAILSAVNDRAILGEDSRIEELAPDLILKIAKEKQLSFEAGAKAERSKVWIEISKLADDDGNILEVHLDKIWEMFKQLSHNKGEVK